MRDKGDRAGAILTEIDGQAIGGRGAVCQIAQIQAVAEDLEEVV